jgi:hypothetical protein
MLKKSDSNASLSKNPNEAFCKLDKQRRKVDKNFSDLFGTNQEPRPSRDLYRSTLSSLHDWRDMQTENKHRELD